MKNFLKLSNKYFFILILFLFIAILSGINNYYFYLHVERSSVRNMSQLETQVIAYQKYCVKHAIESKYCQEGILVLAKAFSEKAYYNDKLILKNPDHVLWEKAVKDWDQVVKSDIEIILPFDLINEKLHINKMITFDNIQVLISILKSMTFSVTDFIKDTNYKHIAQTNGVFNLTNDSLKSNYIKFTINDKEFILNKYHNLKVKDGDYIKQGDLIASGNIFVALDKFLNIYFLRSRPAIGFLLFSFLILYIYRKREIALKEEQNIADQEIIQKVTHNTDIDSNEVYTKLLKYDHIINPPVNTLNADTLFDGDIDEVGTKFRKVAEKIVFKVYEKVIGEIDFRLDLNGAIYQLNKNGIISDAAKNYLSIVRVYGNLSSHYSERTMSKIEAITVASALLNVIEEIVEKSLLKENDNSSNQQNSSVSKTQPSHEMKHSKVKTKGLNIIKKASDK